MDNLFKQSFNYAKIKLYKNYSDLQTKTVIYDSDKPQSGLPHKVVEKEEKVDWDDPFADILKPQPGPEPGRFVVSRRVKDDSYQQVENLNLYKKDQRNFFYTINPTDSFVNHAKKGHPVVECDVVKLVNCKVVKSGQYRPDFFETTKDRHIKKYYFHPFASIEIFKTERWIKRDGDKIIMKYFHQHKTRNLGSRFYKRATNSTTIRFDMVKGNFLVVLYNSSVRKKKKQFYCNSLTSLQEALSSIFNVSSNSLSKMSPLHPSYVERFDDPSFLDACEQMLGIKIDSSTGLGDSKTNKNFIQAWIPRFVELKKIKLPNDGGQLLKLYYPTERYLKKNDRKLVAAILDRIGVLSKLTVKILHEHPNFSLRLLIAMCKIFGEDNTRYMGNISNLFYDRNGNSTVGYEGGLAHLVTERRFITMEHFDITPQEKENMVHIINDMSTIHNTPIHGIIDQFFDHFRMLEKLRQYYPELRLNVRKFGTFTTEHSRLSGLERSIKKGYSTHNIFEKHVIEEIEKLIEYTQLNEPPLMYLPDPKDQAEYERKYANFPVSAIRRVFHPVLLRTTEDYSEEGAFMHHCVAGYIDSDHSIIVSLRCGDERVTSEYRVKDRRCVQSRYVSNTNPPEHFKKALEILDERIRKIPVSIAPLDRRQIPLKINGVPVIPAKREEPDWLNDNFHGMPRPMAEDLRPRPRNRYVNF